MSPYRDDKEAKKTKRMQKEWKQTNDVGFRRKEKDCT